MGHRPTLADLLGGLARERRSFQVEIRGSVPREITRCVMQLPSGLAGPTLMVRVKRIAGAPEDGVIEGGSGEMLEIGYRPIGWIRELFGLGEPRDAHAVFRQARALAFMRAGARNLAQWGCFDPCEIIVTRGFFTPSSRRDSTPT